MPANTLIRPLKNEGELCWELTQKIVPPIVRAQSLEEELAAESENESSGGSFTCLVDLSVERPEGAPLLSLRAIEAD